MSKGISIGTRGGTVGLRPNQTTLESTTYNLPAKTIAKIVPKAYAAPLVIDGVEVIPRLQAGGTTYETGSTTFADMFVVPDGYPMKVTNLSFYNANNSGFTAVRIVSAQGTILHPEVNVQGTFETDYLASLAGSPSEIYLSPGDRIQSKTNFSGYPTRVRISTSFDSNLAYLDPFEVYGGAGGITITGDEFYVTTYETLNVLSGSSLVQGRLLESTTVETSSFNLPAGKMARLVPKRYGAPLVADGETLMPQLEGSFAGNFTVGTTWVTAIAGVPGYRLFYAFGMTGNTLQNAQMRHLRDSGFGDEILKLEDKWGNVTTGTYTTGSPTGLYFDNTLSWNMVLEENEVVQNRSVAAGNGTNVQYKYWPDPESTKDKEFFVYGGAAGIAITGDEFIVEVYG